MLLGPRFVFGPVCFLLGLGINFGASSGAQLVYAMDLLSAQSV